jgi:hypothetical protein
MSEFDSKPFAVRLQSDLGAIIQTRAAAEGITTSELIRNVLHGWAYGEPPGANEGYYHARGQGRRIAHHLLAQAMDNLPASDDEMQELHGAMEAREKAARKR